MRRTRTVTEEYDCCDPEECVACKKSVCDKCNVRIVPPKGFHHHALGDRNACPACAERYALRYEAQMDDLESQQDELWTTYVQGCEAAEEAEAEATSPTQEDSDD